MNRNNKISTPFFFISRFVSLTLILGFVLRIALVLNHQTLVVPAFLDLIKSFVLGAIYDLCFGVLALVPFFVMCFGWTNKKYAKKPGYFIEALLVLGVVYVYCFHSVFDQYGGGAPKIAKIFLSYKLISFSIRFFVPGVRRIWRVISSQLLLFLYIFLLLLNTVSEYFFWNEFGVRYNFIAVDYLIYTNEVIGNIFESYPIIPLLLLIIVVTLSIQWLLQRKQYFVGGDWAQKGMIRTCITMVLCLVMSNVVLHFSRTLFQSENVYVNELQSNGSYDFLVAFQENKLNYQQFYPLLSKARSEMLVRKLCHRNNQNVEVIRDSLPFNKKNIILITVESLSASYLKAYGNDDDLTPNLDRLMTQSLVFDSLFAVGNRTVRGLEALSLCSPPTTGESLIKRQNNGNLHTIGSLLKRLGYKVEFLYGGNSYFDNMGTYFSGNGYQVVDKKDLASNEISFSNIWGACDEDIFKKAIRLMDANSQKGEHSFLHVMTVSNHRPFTFPKGKIKIDGNEKSRAGGVKYTDYAIGEFIASASSKPWFKNTIIVIVADHCASSAGKTRIPIENYHIPAMVYSPGYIRPMRVEKLCSQIDLMPTVLQLMHLSYDSKFIGQDILSPNFVQRAFMATYQDMGYYRNGILTILSPVKSIKQYSVQPRVDDDSAEILLDEKNRQLAEEAQAFYQVANMYVEKEK